MENRNFIDDLGNDIAVPTLINNNTNILIAIFEKAIKDANEAIASTLSAKIDIEYYPNSNDYHHNNNPDDILRIEIDTNTSLEASKSYEDDAAARIYTGEEMSFDFNPSGLMILRSNCGANVFQMHLCPENGLEWEKNNFSYD